MISVCLNDVLKSSKTKEIVPVTNTYLLAHLKKATDHQAEAHITCCLYLLHYMIALLCKLHKDDFKSKIIINKLSHLLYI